MVEGKSPPLNWNEAVEYLKEHLGQKELDEIRFCPRRDLFDLHFSYGLYIRNNLIFRPKNWKLVDAVGAIHVDDISGIILQALWADLNGREFVPNLLSYKKLT